MTEPANDLAPDTAAPPPQDAPSDPPPADPPADPPAGDDPPADPPSGNEPSEPKKKTAEDRIRELVAERNLEREKSIASADFAEFWREKALSGKKVEPEADKPAPKLSDFKGDTEKWSAAYHEYMEGAIEKRVAKGVETHLSKSAEIKQKNEAQSAWHTRLAEFAEKNEGALEAIQDRTFTQTPVMSEVIMASEKGPEIAFYLSENRTENERIKQLPPAMQAAEIARLESKVAAAAKPPPKTPSNAPEPVKPIKAGGSASVNLETCSMDDYYAARIPGYKKGGK